MNMDDVKRWADVRPGYWFAPKLFGWGATPVTWQGWALTGAVVVAAVGVAWLAQGRSPWVLLLLAPVLAGFIALTIAKTDGSWRWR